MVLLIPRESKGESKKFTQTLSNPSCLISFKGWDDFIKHGNISPRRQSSVTLCLNSPETHALIPSLLSCWMDLKWPVSILNPSTCSWSRKEEPLIDPILLWNKVFKSTKGRLNPEALRESLAYLPRESTLPCWLTFIQPDNMNSVLFSNSNYGCQSSISVLAGYQTLYI